MGWNGLRFTVPADWQIDGIGRRYLLLASDAGPAMEATFNQVRGRFSLKKALRKLAAGAGGARLAAEPLPQAWQAALGRYETAGFAWSGKRGAGQGAVLYCPVCRKATVIQFYRAGAGPDFGPAARVLASFADHPRAGEALWAVFDFRAEAPERFTLTSHRIAAGTLELTLAAPGQTLRLYRWGPASALLAGRDLAAFARERLQLPVFPGPAGKNPAGGGEALEWSAAPGRVWRRLLRPGRRYDRARVWRLPEKNRILAVRLTGRRPGEAGFMDALSSKVTSV
jgi:hypothetical protein